MKKMCNEDKQVICKFGVRVCICNDKDCPERITK